VIDLTGDGDETGAFLVRRVSHAIMNDLAVVRLLLDSANDPGLSPEGAAGLAKAADLVGDVADLLGQLSSLARPSTGPVDTDLREIVGRIDRLLAVVAGPAGTLRAELPERPVVASVDPRRAQHRLLADVAALSDVVQAGATITVAVGDDGITVVAGDAVLHS
jgi:hypothetical protein